jgi:hypothetical protein
MNTLPELPVGAADRMNVRISRAVQKPPRHRHRRAAIIASVIGVAVLGAGATSVAVAASTNRPTAVYCFEHTDVNSRHITVPMTPVAPTKPSKNRFAVAINNCAGAWLDGAFTKHHHPVSGTEVPPLVLCVLHDNNAAAFPDTTYDMTDSDTLCARLGLRNAY